MNDKIKKIIIIAIIIIVFIIILRLLSQNKTESAYIELVGNQVMIINQNDVFKDPGYEIMGTTNENNYYMNVDGYVNSNISGSYNLTYSLYRKDGTLMHELIRQVIVLDNALTYVDVYLKGENEEYYFPNDYIDNGAEAYNKDELITDQLVIESNVRENEIGDYDVRYQIVSNNNYVEAVRKVHIVNYNIEREIDEKNQVINFMVKCDGYSHTVLPDGNEVYSKYISMSYNDVGTYEFDIYLKSGSHKKYLVEINEIKKEEEHQEPEKPKIPSVKITGSCSLAYKNNKTRITMKLNSPSQVSRYIVNGMQYKTNPITVTGTLGKVTVIVFNKANKPFTIKCENTFSGGFFQINESKLGWFPCNNDVSAANQELAAKINSYGERTRAAVATAAAYLANYKFNIQYFWAGKYDQKGLNPKWGCNAGVVEKQYCSVKTGPNSCQLGLDCTGFRKWAFIQAGFDTGVVPRYGNVWGDWNGYKYQYTFGSSGDAAKYIKAGDTVSTDDHVGVVIGVEGDRIQVAHESGGIKVSILSKSTGRSLNSNGDFKYFTLMDEYYRMYGRT